MDVVGVRKRCVAETVVVLQRNLDIDRPLRRGHFSMHVEGTFVNWPLGAVQVPDERDDPTFEVERHLLVCALVNQGELEALGEICRFTEPVSDRLELIIMSILEDLGISKKTRRRSVRALQRLSDHVDWRGRKSATVFLAIDAGVALLDDFYRCPLRKRVDNGSAYAVQPARHLVPSATELPAGVERRHDHFERGFIGLLVGVNRDATAIVDNGHDVVGTDSANDMIAVAGQGFIDGVVDDLANEMMEPSLIGVADVHAWSPTNTLESLKDLNLIGVVSWFREGVFQSGCHVMFSFRSKDWNSH